MKYLENLLAVSYYDVTEAKEALEQFFEPEDVTINESGIYLHGLKLYETNGSGFSASRGFSNSLRRNNLVEIYNMCREYGYLALLSAFGWANIANRKDDIKEKLILLHEYKINPENIPRTWCEQYSPTRLGRILKGRYAGKARANRPESRR